MKSEIKMVLIFIFLCVWLSLSVCQRKTQASLIKSRFICCLLTMHHFQLFSTHTETHSWSYSPGQGSLEQLSLPPSQVLKQRGNTNIIIFLFLFFLVVRCVVHACTVGIVLTSCYIHQGLQWSPLVPAFVQCWGPGRDSLLCPHRQSR